MTNLFTYNVFSLIFNSTLELKNIKAGLDAQSFIYEQNNNEVFSVTYVYFSEQTYQNMQLGESELLNYVKSTFLGITKPPISNLERQILGKKSIGEIFISKIPVASDIEIHLINLQNNDKICIAFKTTKDLTEKVREIQIYEILKSLKSN